MIHIEEINLEGKFYVVTYCDDRYSSNSECEFRMSIHRNVVEREATKRDKLKGHVKWSGHEDYISFNIDFDEFEQSIDYRKELDSLIEELVIEAIDSKQEGKDKYKEVKGYVKELEYPFDKDKYIQDGSNS